MTENVVEWIDSATGRRCLAVRHDLIPSGSYWCGYVQASHRLVRSDDGEFAVHGGVTYKGPMPGNDPLPCLGFDCAHAFDTIERRCDLDYVKEQCAKLAAQIAQTAL